MNLIKNTWYRFSHFYSVRATFSLVRMDEFGKVILEELYLVRSYFHLLSNLIPRLWLPASPYLLNLFSRVSLPRRLAVALITGHGNSNLSATKLRLLPQSSSNLFKKAARTIITMPRP